MKTHSAIFIPVRLASTRLPEKALSSIHGKPILEHLVDRSRLSTQADRVVICTTCEPYDDPLEELCARSGVDIFRGSNEDLLQRFLDAAHHYGVTHILNIDGDDVMMDPNQVDEVAVAIKDPDWDYVRMSGMPFGANPLALTVDALERVCAEKSSSDTATGWGVYFESSDAFRRKTITVTDADLMRPDIRVTLDYPEDLEFITAIYDALYREGEPVRIRDVVELLNEQPDLLEINAGLEGKYWKHVSENQTGA